MINDHGGTKFFSGIFAIICIFAGFAFIIAHGQTASDTIPAVVDLAPVIAPEPAAVVEPPPPVALIFAKTTEELKNEPIICQAKTCFFSKDFKIENGCISFLIDEMQSIRGKIEKIEFCGTFSINTMQ